MATKSKFTPGPWIIDEHQNISSQSGDSICFLWHTDPNATPDARLISKAPEMHELLTLLPAFLESTIVQQMSRAKIEEILKFRNKVQAILSEINQPKKRASTESLTTTNKKGE